MRGEETYFRDAPTFSDMGGRHRAGRDLGQAQRGQAAHDRRDQGQHQPGAGTGRGPHEAFTGRQGRHAPGGHDEPEKEEQEDADDDFGLEFLSVDHILDVDKLRDMFQTVLDDTISDGHDSRGSEDSSADLLFFGDDFIDDQQEPQVTFSMEENKSEINSKAQKE